MLVPSWCCGRLGWLGGRLLGKCRNAPSPTWLGCMMCGFSRVQGKGICISLMKLSRGDSVPLVSRKLRTPAEGEGGGSRSAGGAAHDKAPVHAVQPAQAEAVPTRPGSRLMLQVLHSSTTDRSSLHWQCHRCPKITVPDNHKVNTRTSTRSTTPSSSGAPHLWPAARAWPPPARSTRRTQWAPP